ncbi:GIY-YIG nuclease family protein [Testudinibacter sp. TR-2022]|uniref:GIY-YIG nuclease family protein n=1 Tax=Testudinibacter sp. TR-2022 TaxID=2585029 RepID=UPI00111A8B84|nr:GIY-YIG nuclease family protein [Testudinibacter sp. TR-2022]TNH05143.1 GIY-YIG nuclease family protein [Pasteurellaceae bacterium Phil31]TNH09679.1 GIY-YIG nuclease family protein [Testudinibacter sp. TR-2022]TNH11165.1 GIY-YIG nuclease family protein [Testudinibacter sp. TR-2022]TNH14939.1 GIY-YIG nuclease family protein [Testudinibacter sp. TR-2022]TNH20388.1 GIY-YIG nuclease family protein [Testudinibacter sp. TR-2022]
MKHLTELGLPLIEPHVAQHIEPSNTGLAPTKPWSVYLLHCSNQAFYCGISNQPEERFKAHLAGKGAKFTRMYPPLEMRLVYQALSRAEASRLEAKIKGLTAAQKRSLWCHLAEYLSC